MKKRNKGKKSLTAVGAVVAAGLTPGILAATPGCLPGQGSNAEITAADVVAFDGMAYGFDELYAKQQPDSVEMNEIVLDIVLEPDTTVLDLDNYGAIASSKYGVRITRFNNDYEIIDGDTICRSVDSAPNFPGGDAELMKYIDSQIQYPANAIANRVQGRIVVKFVVKSTGEVGTVRVLHSVDKELADEAVRVVKSLPNFIPARQSGRAVSVWHTVPVTFKLPEENND